MKKVRFDNISVILYFCTSREERINNYYLDKLRFKQQCLNFERLFLVARKRYKYKSTQNFDSFLE